MNKKTNLFVLMHQVKEELNVLNMAHVTGRLSEDDYFKFLESLEFNLPPKFKTVGHK